jgi:succinate-semialdehyde dehydrogenase/glutarate-semialdehyde dehydrogenase
MQLYDSAISARLLPRRLTDVTDDNPARYWEFFGPVSQVIRAKDETDAIRIAND